MIPIKIIRPGGLFIDTNTPRPAIKAGTHPHQSKVVMPTHPGMVDPTMPGNTC